MKPRVGGRGTRLAPLVFVCALVMVTATAAGATFSGPVTVSTSPADNSQVAVAPDGDAVVVWRVHDGTSYRVRSRSLSAAGVLGSPRNLSPAGKDALFPQVAVDADGDATVAWWSDYLVDGSTRREARARQISAAGALGPAHTLSQGAGLAGPPQVAVNADGEATVAWWQDVYDGRYRYVVKARTLSATGILGPTLDASTLSRLVLSEPQVGVDADGDATVVWESYNGTNNRVQARIISASGGLGTIRNLSAALPYAAGPQLAVAPGGESTVGWRIHDDAIFNSFRIQARTLTADGVPGPLRYVSAPGQNASSPQVAVDGDGEATLVWRVRDGADHRVQTRTLSGAGVLGPIRTLSAAGQDAELPQVAVDADGDAVVVWQIVGGPTSTVEARTLSATGTLHPTQVLSTNGTRAAVSSSQVGVATVTWTDLRNGSRIRAAQGP